jgi:hypothetical protein
MSDDPWAKRPAVLEWSRDVVSLIRATKLQRLRVFALCPLHASERYCAGKRLRSRPNRAAIVAAMNDPLAIRRLSRDDPDMMRPDHHHADSRAAGIHAFARPGARERQATVRFSKIFAQVTAAPGVRPMTVMPVVGTRFCLNGKDDQERRRDKEGL